MKERARAAMAVLRSTGVDILEAAILARELLAAGRGAERWSLLGSVKRIPVTNPLLWAGWY